LQYHATSGRHFHFLETYMSTVSRTPYGNMTIDSLFAAETLTNIGRRSNRWQVLEAFLRHSEGRAVRVSEGSSGMLILVGIPNQPNSCAFYLYDEINRHFFMLSFEEKETFHASLFDYIVTFYDLGQYIEVPRLRLVEKKQQSADKVNVPSVSHNKSHNRKKFYKQRQPRVPQAVVRAASQNVGQVATA
jgi:hypothetical protein